MPSSAAGFRRQVVNVINSLPGGDALLDQYRSLRGRFDPRVRRAHRGPVGDMWDEIGKVQLDFMIGQGLQPHDVLLDVACGSLRAGRLFIDYLEPGNYLGLDHNRWLIRAGLRYEVPKAVQRKKRPEFVVSDSFEFRKLSKRPSYAIAQSLFSHLTKDDIALCLGNLIEVMPEGGRFYATFVPRRYVPPGYSNPNESADDETFAYDTAELLNLGTAAGWETSYIGDWSHPRGQEMLAFAKAGS